MNSASVLVFNAFVASAFAFAFACAGCSGSTSIDTTAPTGLPADTGTNPAEGVTAGGSLLAAEAARELSAMQSSYYSHDVNVVESTGTFDYDCSGFVDYALIRVLPAHYREFVAATRPRPLAQDYVDFFMTPPADWKVITDATQLLAGDILAWLAAPDDNGDTGHVMIVRNAPVADASHSSSSLRALDVDIWDSTPDVHGDTDTRKATGATGLGAATVVLYVDANGVPTMHAWSPISSSTDTTQTSMGRAR